MVSLLHSNPNDSFQLIEPTPRYNKGTLKTLKQVFHHLRFKNYTLVIYITLVITSICIYTKFNFSAPKLNAQMDKQTDSEKSYQIIKQVFLYNIARYIIMQFQYIISAPLLETYKVKVSESLYKEFLATNQTITFGRIQVILRNTSFGMARILQIIFFDILNNTISLLLTITTITLNYGVKYNLILLSMVFVLIILQIITNKISTYLKSKMIIYSYFVNQHLRETEHNLDIIKAHNLEEREKLKFTEFLNKHKRVSILYSITGSLKGAAFPVILQIFSFWVLIDFLNSDLTMDHKNQNIRYLSFLIGFIYWNIRNFARLYTNFLVNLVQVKDGISILSNTRGINNKNKNKEKLINWNYIKFFNFSYAISKYKRVNIKNIDIIRGQKIAIVGNNGSGKSTFLRVLCGLEERYEGEIFFDKKMFREVELKIGYVPQNVQLFNDTLQYNTGEIMDKELWDLRESVGKSGINVGDFGFNLSKGKQQITQIVRAFGKGKDFVCLDEPMNHLDEEVSKKVLEIIFGDKNLTVFIVSHNKNIIGRCDKVILIN